MAAPRRAGQNLFQKAWHLKQIIAVMFWRLESV